MTDMLISLNAGLLVMGILGAVDPKHESDWRRLQQETVRFEQEAAELRHRTHALRLRHQMFIEECTPKAAPERAGDKASDKDALVVSRPVSTNAN